MEGISHPLNGFGSSLELVVLDVSHSNPYDFTAIHRHSYFEVMLFDEGHGGMQTIDFREYEIEDRCLYVVVPNQVHLMRRKAAEDGLVVQFTRSFLMQSITPFQLDWLFQLGASPKMRLEEARYGELRALTERLRAELDGEGIFQAQRVRQLFGYWFFSVLDRLPAQGAAPPGQNCAWDFMRMVEEKFKEVKSVKQYAELLQIPVNKITQDVKRQFGKSPLQLIHDAILVEIKRLLAVEQLSHKEIAYELQFDSPSSYSRFIKQKTALTPSQLKAQTLQIAQQ